jgi:hypothetical protein
MRKTVMRILAATVICFMSSPLVAQVTAKPVWTSSTGNYNGTSILAYLDSQTKSYAYLTSPSGGYLKTGVASEAKINFNGKGGAAYGVYGWAEGTGPAGPAGSLNDIAGVVGAAEKNGPYWAAGVHADCRDGAPGGVCIGVSVELLEVSNQSQYFGMNIQPSASAKGSVVGIQFQRPQAYRYSIDAANTYIKMGSSGSTPFCMRFNESQQLLEFWRGCQNPGAIRMGYIRMSPGTGDFQMN